MKAKDANEIPLSESTVSLKLALIQRRCAELLDDDELELSLEEAIADTDDSNPYCRG